MKLSYFDHIPDAVANISPRAIKQVFPNPTLINVPGKKAEPVFISTVLHGNETTSFRVLQHLQRSVATKRPERSLMVFVGNVDATERGVRRLEGQPDFNRLWASGPGKFYMIAQNVLREARRQRVFASIDIHNNTGANPIYGCINVLRAADLQLAAMFAPIGVFYLMPSTTQSIAFSRLCPSITLECGRSEDPNGIAAATRLVDAVIQMEGFDVRPPSEEALSLYQTVGRVVVDPDCTFSFGQPGADLILQEDLEGYNFRQLDAETNWARTEGASPPLRVFDEHDDDVTANFFRFHDGVISLSRAIVPSMITTDQTVIRQDCLCYFMEAI
jgi:hypothetical protein